MRGSSVLRNSNSSRGIHCLIGTTAGEAGGTVTSTSTSTSTSSCGIPRGAPLLPASLTLAAPLLLQVFRSSQCFWLGGLTSSFSSSFTREATTMSLRSPIQAAIIHISFPTAASSSSTAATSTPSSTITSTTGTTSTVGILVGDALAELWQQAVLHIKRTFQPSLLKRKRKGGFLVRMRTTLGRKMLRRRRHKGRKRLDIGI